MSPIRYRRTSVRTALGITAEEKRIKRELGITAILRPFRWWGNEKRKIKREAGYYSPDAQLARHVLPHSIGKLLMLCLIVLGIPFAAGWFFQVNDEPSNTGGSGQRLVEAGQIEVAAKSCESGRKTFTPSSEAIPAPTEQTGWSPELQAAGRRTLQTHGTSRNEQWNVRVNGWPCW